MEKVDIYPKFESTVAHPAVIQVITVVSMFTDRYPVQDIVLNIKERDKV